jgi:hypothetical protein
VDASLQDFFRCGKTGRQLRVCLESTMNDLLFLAILAGCLALTFGLVRMCAALMPHETSGSKP